MSDLPENLPGNQETDMDWERRRLCLDESCIGVIGSDGRCQVCGLFDPGASENTPLSMKTDRGEDEPIASSDVDRSAENQESEWEDRKLCRDDSCIGTIGDDGRCRICGLAE
jgi:hypothetical protein